jgi:hypothetical protein
VYKLLRFNKKAENLLTSWAIIRISPRALSHEIINISAAWYYLNLHGSWVLHQSETVPVNVIHSLLRHWVETSSRAYPASKESWTNGGSGGCSSSGHSDNSPFSSVNIKITRKYIYNHAIIQGVEVNETTMTLPFNVSVEGGENPYTEL